MTGREQRVDHDQRVLEALRLWADDPAQAGRERFVLPLPGAGCGGLDPDRVKRLCRTHLDGRFVVCTK